MNIHDFLFYPRFTIYYPHLFCEGAMPPLHLLSPRGFAASGVHAGIKSKHAPDVGLLICDRPAAAAAAFTTNKVFAAPVKLGRKHVQRGLLRGVVVNSGNANACTGAQGERDALRMCELAGSVANCRATQILPSSTGIIGHLLPMKKLERGIIEAGQYLGSSLEHAHLFSDAILTTDTRRKSASARFKLGRETVTLAGVCKGSGMIGPRMAVPGKAGALHATMLAYLTTDAGATAATLRKLLAPAVDRSFNAVTVDDHTSTNDTAVLLASGASGAKINSMTSAKRFLDALTEVCQSLAYQIAADGEGATKVVKITVRGAKATAAANAMARAIANSPLVKCAMHGNDPNWGRIVSAAGLAGVAFDPEKCVLTLQGTAVFRGGRPLQFSAAAVSKSLDAREVIVDLDCRAGSGEATVWTCDLSKEYVAINADYHT
jgi:glutamate N-acetyltransferase/amino-acid N-acetyltransferase